MTTTLIKNLAPHRADKLLEVITRRFPEEKFLLVDEGSRGISICVDKPQDLKDEITTLKLAAFIEGVYAGMLWTSNKLMELTKEL